MNNPTMWLLLTKVHQDYLLQEARKSRSLRGIRPAKGRDSQSGESNRRSLTSGHDLAECPCPVSQA